MKKNGSWFGSWRVYGSKGKVIRKAMAIGRISELSEEEARAQLEKLSRREESLSSLVRKLRPSAALLETACTKDLNATLPPQLRGAIAEMAVAIDLCKRGYSVFKPMHAFEGCDLLYLDGETPVRVEVKRTSLNKKGHPICDLRRNLGKFDVLAMLLPDGRIEYRAHSALLHNGTGSDGLLTTEEPKHGE